MGLISVPVALPVNRNITASQSTHIVTIDHHWYHAHTDYIILISAVNAARATVPTNTDKIMRH